MTSSLASASSWSDDISWSNEGYASQAGSLSKVGGVPVLTGTPEGLLLQAGDVGISGGGLLADQPWSVFGTSSTTVGTHRAYVEGWNRQIGVRSSWSEEVVFSGPAGTLHTNLGVFLDFSYLLPGGTGAYVEAVLTLDVYQQFTKLATFEIAVSYERPIGGEMAGQWSLSGILCARHSMTRRSMYAKQEDDEGGRGRSGEVADDPEGAH